MDREKRIIDMTLGELSSFLDERDARLKAELADIVGVRTPDVVYGLEGIAQLYGCSKRTAGRIKASGIIDDAITQYGKTIVVDATKALSSYPIHVKQH